MRDHSKIALAVASLALAFGACTSEPATTEVETPAPTTEPSSPTPTSASPNTAPSTEPASPSPTAAGKPVATDSVTVTCAESLKLVIPRAEPIAFRPAWGQAAESCTSGQQVVPTSATEIAAYATAGTAAGYSDDDVSTLYGICASVEPGGLYLDQTYTLSAAQTSELNGAMTLCPTHPSVAGWVAAIGRAGGTPAAPAGLRDLTTDEHLCSLDSELTALQVNDALAPALGLPSNRDLRTEADDEALRAHKNAAFQRSCPERAT